MIIGLVGPNASGKGEVAAYLATQGFEVFSLSDIVREEAAKLTLPPSRDVLIRLGQRLRAEGGPGVLAVRILPRLGSRAAVDSIRAPAEVEVLRRRDDFHLLGIDAPLEIRWRRAGARGRIGDAVGLDEFRRQEARENTSDPRAQQVRRTLALADETLLNEGSLEELHRQVGVLIDRWAGAGDAPTPPDAPGDRTG